MAQLRAIGGMAKAKGRNKHKRERAKERDQSEDATSVEELTINQIVHRREAERA